MKRLALLLIFLTARIFAAEPGAVTLGKRDLSPGKTVSLVGDWLYQPGYSVTASEQPQSVIDTKECVPVPVPQLLNRIRWWLDDSVDYFQSETARLKRLGFDTGRAEDGWYYLKLNLPAIPAGKHLYIDFDGVAMICRTYCNGQLLGEHKGMFSRFDYDLTPQLKAGQNLIAVYVSMEKIPPSTLTMGQAVTVNLTASKVRSMSKGMFGPMWPSAENRDYDLHGIWQPVKLVVRGEAKLDDVWFVPSLTGAEVRVSARVLTREPIQIKAVWTEVKSGRRFAEAGTEVFSPDALPIERTLKLNDVHPALWTPADPNLYRLEVAVEDDKGKVLDLWSQNVGFRTFEIKGNQFFLNGHPYWLRGGDHLPYGKNPFDPKLARVLIQQLHDNNIRVTRTHATPWNEAWLSAADEIGLGVSLEGIRPWGLSGKIGPTPPDLFAHWLMENEDVVKRARNHPSVFIYTVGNEMMLRDNKNLDKWTQLSDVVKQTRQLDPTRPVICSSEYTRDPEFYNDTLKPNGIDDGDADDLHRYNNWYAPSSFVTDAKLEKEVKNNGGTRPLMGQEMSSGYPDLDNGLPVARYTYDLLTPQAWVGELAYPGSDPRYFLEHHRAVTKRWAERLRFERGTNTAGFMLFAAECWFSHTYDADSVKPYPVVAAMREAFAPIGLALESGRRHFFGGEELETAVFVSNDDENYHDLSGGELEAEFLDRQHGNKISSQKLGVISAVRYGGTKRFPVKLMFPAASGRSAMILRLRLVNAGKEVTSTSDHIDVLPMAKPVEIAASLATIDLGPALSGFLKTTARFQDETDAAKAQVVLLGTKSDLSGLAPTGVLRTAIENGATAIVFSPGESFTKLFSADVYEAKNSPGEFADFAPCAGTMLAADLQPMDLKWWGRANDWRVFVADTSHRLKPGSAARELIRFIPSHGYIPADKVPEQYRTVLFEIALGKGRLWVCDLDLEASVAVDPLAQQFALNLLRAAATPDSTSKLPKMESHKPPPPSVAK